MPQYKEMTVEDREEDYMKFWTGFMRWLSPAEAASLRTQEDIQRKMYEWLAKDGDTALAEKKLANINYPIMSRYGLRKIDENKMPEQQQIIIEHDPTIDPRSLLVNLLRVIYEREQRTQELVEGEMRKETLQKDIKDVYGESLVPVKKNKYGF